MPRRNIYVREGDQELFDWAEQQGGESLSALVVDILRQHKQRLGRQAELQAKGFEPITVEVEDKEGRIRKKQFEGRWLVSDFESETAKGQYGAALGKRGGLVITHYDKYQPDIADLFRVFESFDDFASEDFGEDFVSAVAAEMGEEFVEVLDV